jgi:hypothetical protein
MFHNPQDEAVLAKQQGLTTTDFVGKFHRSRLRYYESWHYGMERPIAVIILGYYEIHKLQPSSAF